MKKKKPLFSSVTFIKSITDHKQKPLPAMTEFAFVGRSNVGKSSLLNAVFGRKNMAKISSSPGKTRVINFYSVSEKFYCVDLPGYGFARLSQQEQVKWQQMIEGYLLDNKELKCIYVLVDSRHERMALDMQMLEWLALKALPFKIVLSKTDKITSGLLQKRLNEWSRDLQNVPLIPFSIRKPEFIVALQKDMIDQLQL